jgi:TonB family protein
MSGRFALAALIALSAAPAAAQVAWTAAPTAAEMAAAYPEKARAAGVGGAVDLACSVAPSGTLNDCDVVGELPRGMGFGAAARQLARKLKPAGMNRGAELKVPITFAPELAKGGVVTVKTPQWTALPSVTELQAAVPKTEGGPNDVRVTLVCDVQAGGALGGCAVDREEPAGQGFGEAILALAPRFKTSLMSIEGMPTVGAKVRVPVRFALKPVEQAAK